MRLVAVGALAALFAGAALLADATLHGRANLSLVVIVPVLSGGSGEFLLGVVLLLVGLFLLSWAFWEVAESPTGVSPLEGPEGPETTPPGSGMVGGGVVLIGPVPLFFGGWKNVSRRARLVAAVVGAAVLVLFVVGFVLTVR
jgi:uncharacterized protein (TIGR00304 family)